MTPEGRRRRAVRTPVIVVTALAWILLALSTYSGSALAEPSRPSEVAAVPDAHATGHTHHVEAGSAPVDPHGVHGGDASAPYLLVLMTLMTAAMMSPYAVPSVRHVMARSLRRRRRRAIALLILVEGAIWWTAGAALLGVAAISSDLLGSGPALVATVVAVVAWQASPAKQRCLNRHDGSPPIAAFGRRADLDVLRFGVRHALWCVGSCWALMLLPLAVGSHHLVVMVLVCLWMWTEMLDRPSAPAWRARLPRRAGWIAASYLRPTR